MRMFVTTLISLFLLSLSACSTTPVPQPKPVVQVVKAVPPSSLLELCKRVERLRQWYEQPTKDVQPQPEVGARVGPLPD